MEKFHYHPDVWQHVHKYSFSETSHNKEMFVSKLVTLFKTNFGHRAVDSYLLNDH